MAASDFSAFYFDNPDWMGQDTSDFLFDSPQSDHQPLSRIADNPTPSKKQNNIEELRPKVEPRDIHPGSSPRQDPSEQAFPHLSVAHEPSSVPSSASASSSRSSSNDSPSHKKRQHSSNSSSTVNSAMKAAESSRTIKTEDAFDFDDIKVEDNNFSVDNEMDSLSLAPGSSGIEFNTSPPMDSFVTPSFFADGRGNTSFSPNPATSLNRQTSSNQAPVTIQPSKTFALGPSSREESPNDAGLFHSNESSPFPMSGNSPLSHTMDGMDSMLAAEGPTPQSSLAQGALSLGSTASPSLIRSKQLPPSRRRKRPENGWPCHLDVQAEPDKSRVETQIPVKLTLQNPPPGIRRLHLPSYTISKPKFQQRHPLWQRSNDALELTCLLYCASAMQKEGVPDRAFERGESEEVPERKDESHATPKEPDESDPERPLNGGPVAICSGCIIRERKRAARKKTKKPDEDEEWARDEARRVVVFNCSEVRDWCVPGTKETPVREHEGPLDKIVVMAPMRIACYCRHQSEKVGFQVLFTLRKMDGEIVAQQLSPSIMITDDHKQPMPQPGMPPGMAFTHGGAMANPGVFQSGQMGMFQFNQPLAFRPSWSTNDLRLLNPQLNPHLKSQYGPHNQDFWPQSSNQSEVTTASTTPRNLSRPASPTNPSGQPGSKKRRSGGISQSRMPGGLTMTQIETSKSPTGQSAAPNNQTAPGSGPPSAGYVFNSPTSSTFGASTDQPVATHQHQHHVRSTSSFQSGPPTPGGPAQYGLSAQSEDPYQYFSAPTSQHPSRAPSPTLTSRPAIRQNPFTSANSQASEAAMALSSLPSGLDIHRPPTIKRIIPPYGHRQGGEEVTVLGTGFYRGLEIIFGDVPAKSTTYWGDTTLVCRAPPSPFVGPVGVVFKHQHHTAPPALKQMSGLMPFQIQTFYYFGDDPKMSNQQSRFPNFSIGPTSNPTSPIGTPGLQQHQPQQQPQQQAACAMDFFPGGPAGYASANFARAAAANGAGIGSVDGTARQMPQRQFSGDPNMRTKMR